MRRGTGESEEGLGKNGRHRESEEGLGKNGRHREEWEAQGKVRRG